MKIIESAVHARSEGKEEITFYGDCNLAYFLGNIMNPSSDADTLYAGKKHLDELYNSNNEYLQVRIGDNLITLVYQPDYSVPEIDFSQIIASSNTPFNKKELRKHVLNIIDPHDCLVEILITRFKEYSSWKDYCDYLTREECGDESKKANSKPELKAMLRESQNSWDNDHNRPLMQLYYGGPLMFDVAIASLVVTSIGVFFQPLINDVYDKIKENLKKAIKKNQVYSVNFRILDQDGIKSVLISIPKELIEDDKTPEIVLSLIEGKKKDIKKVLTSRKGYREVYLGRITKDGKKLKLDVDRYFDKENESEDD